ncbi:hypothetical protein [Haladaptatus cibarius]|uniref:hypothetical protein n=1 Tax=Haladaptatus cibarius TaxID=453847 RepID=UPI0011857E18|nr:hypothetical protein [Haladaptatus cibarius]
MSTEPLLGLVLLVLATIGFTILVAAFLGLLFLVAIVLNVIMTVLTIPVLLLTPAPRTFWLAVTGRLWRYSADVTESRFWSRTLYSCSSSVSGR